MIKSIFNFSAVDLIFKIRININMLTEKRVDSANTSVMSPDEINKLEDITVPDLIILGKNYHPDLETIVNRIRIRTYYDVSTLHEVEKFIEEKSNDDPEIIATLYRGKP